MSFSEYLANLRLENAINDMLDKNSTVSAAALENGFANVKSFITQCKRSTVLHRRSIKRNFSTDKILKAQNFVMVLSLFAYGIQPFLIDKVYP